MEAVVDVQVQVGVVETVLVLLVIPRRRSTSRSTRSSNSTVLALRSSNTADDSEWCTHGSNAVRRNTVLVKLMQAMALPNRRPSCKDGC